MTGRLPACKAYPRSAPAVSIRGDRVSLYYPDLDYGTIDSFPLRSAFAAEAHGAGEGRRLFVHFRSDVVTTDVPFYKGHNRSDTFSGDADRDTTEGLGAALTRLHQLLASGLADQWDSLPEMARVQSDDEVITA